MASARTSDQLTAPRTPRLLVVVAILAVLVGVAGLVVPRLAGDADEDPAEAEVIARVDDFASVYNTYDVTDLEGYQERMRPLLTDTYYAEFTRVTDAVFGALESNDQRSGDVRVLGVAVDTMDDDSAVALVAVDAAITTAADDAAVQRRFRWKVTLSQVEGEWLVNQFETVVPLDATTGEAAPEGEPGGAPSAEPTTDPTTGPTPTEGEGE